MKIEELGEIERGTHRQPSRHWPDGDDARSDAAPGPQPRAAAGGRSPAGAGLQARARRLLAAAARRRRPAVDRPRLPDRGGAQPDRSRPRRRAPADARCASAGERRRPRRRAIEAARRARSRRRCSRGRRGPSAVAAQPELVAAIDTRRDLNAQLTGELQDAAQRGSRRPSTRIGSADAGAPRCCRSDRSRARCRGRRARTRARAASAAAPSAGAQGRRATASRSPCRRARRSGPSTTGPWPLPTCSPATATWSSSSTADRTYSLYGYLASLTVGQGDHVDAQAPSGVRPRPAGNPSLYFELRVDGKPVDPLQWLERTGVTPPPRTGRAGIQHDLKTRSPSSSFRRRFWRSSLVGGADRQGASAGGGDQPYQHLRVFEDVVSLVMNNYVEPVKVDRVMEGAMRGLADGLDPDSAFLTAKQVKAIEAGEALPDGDVGLELTRQYYLRVISARDGSPAAKAGLQTGDYVRAIDGKPTRDMSVFEGMRLLRGQPGIEGHADGHPRQRRRPARRSAGPREAAGAGRHRQLIGTDTGYVRIASFRQDVTADLKKQAADLAKSGAKSADRRHPAHRRRPVRQRHRRRAAVREVAARWSQAGGPDAKAATKIAAKAGRRRDRHAGDAAGHDRHVRRRRSLRRRARRQQARGPRRRAHARPRRHAETGQAAGQPRPLAHLRALPDARTASRSRARGSSRRSQVDEPDVDFGAPAPDDRPDPRRGARAQAKTEAAA